MFWLPKRFDIVSFCGTTRCDLVWRCFYLKSVSWCVLMLNDALRRYKHLHTKPHLAVPQKLTMSERFGNQNILS
jgi:hypothetical protein